jgi:VIT1/CCC1 family predicted Fe2+/Mn2+ transporter
MDLEKLPAIMFIVLGITALLYLLVFVFNMMSLITVFIIVAFVLAILAIITGVLMLKEGGE